MLHADGRCCNARCLNCIFGFRPIDLSDLCYDPSLFTRDLCSYAEYLQIGFGIRKIIIGQILLRVFVPYEQFDQHAVTTKEEISLRVA